MKKVALLLAAVIPFCLSVAYGSERVEKGVNESPRNIPIAYDVDIVVVGGTTAGVTAAVEAARHGAKVFLAAPRPYLGEDMCATYRLWLEPDEEPTSMIAHDLFDAPRRIEGIPFTYEADQPSTYVHKDTKPPSMLADGRWNTAFTESVQYNDDVTIIVDLGEKRRFGKIHVMAFQSNNDYEVESVVVSTSDDRQMWRQIAALKNEKLGQGQFVRSAIDVAARVSGAARHFRFFVRKGPKARRILIGEILIESQQGVEKKKEGCAVTTPMQVKRTLDRALLDAGVQFLYGCYAAEVLHDAEGYLAGIVMANRAGRQAVKAKVIIDATDRAWVARMAGCAFRPYPAGPQTFKRVVVGGEIRHGEGIKARKIRLRNPIGGKPPTPYGSGAAAIRANASMSRKFDEIIEYTLTIPMADGAFASFAEAEQVARDWTFHPEQVDESEVLFQVPPDPVKGEASPSGTWPGAEKVSLSAFRPAGTRRLFVLGGCADVPRDWAEKLLHPLELMKAGARIGAAAAVEAKRTPDLRGVRLAGKPRSQAAPGDTRDPLRGVRPTQTELPTVPADERSCPIFGEYDVVVVGGGTSGAPAGIGAARQGARTLVIEYLNALGGVGTTGLIGMYCAGYRKGFTEETEKGIRRIGAPSYVVGKKEWWRRENRRAGADIWFGVLGCGAFVEGGRVKGVVVATPQGRGVVLAKVVIDSTGNADVAAAAGASCMYTNGSYIGVQGAGLPYRETGATYINTDWTFIDDSDLMDVWSALIVAKDMYRNAYDIGQLIDTRERRRIVGEHILSPLDVVNQRTFPDTVGISNGGRLDKHSFTVHPYFMVSNWLGGISYIPYRCLLPKGLNGILVTGLGISAHCDAIPSIRMQPDIQNLGYAAGVAAAMAAKAGVPTREIDIKALQRHLVSKRCLTPKVLTHADSFPIPDSKVETAVRALAEKDYSSLGVILARQDISIPLMRNAYRDTQVTHEGKLRCAHVLGILGDAEGVETLIAKVNSYTQFDEESIGRYFPCITWLDSYIIALGYTRDRRALDPLLKKLALLGASSGHRFSHYRAVSLALERLGEPAAAQPLAKLLKKLGMANGAVATMKDARTKRRNRSGLRNLILARALYRCGDFEGIGEKTLKQYAQDLRGHYARHAQAVLQESPGKAEQ